MANYNTKICIELQLESHAFWSYLSDVFSYQLKGSEIGATNHLIYFITSFYQGKHKGLEVYCKNAPDEKLRGADIDLYIQNQSGTYDLFMLQAKIMNHKGVYYAIENWAPDAQYNILIDNAKSKMCTPLYLFYNGSTNNSKTGNSDYGLSCVSANFIQSEKLNQLQNLRKGKAINFDMLKSNMFPFHYLFCPNNDVNRFLPETSLYEFTYEEIVSNTNGIYTRIQLTNQSNMDDDEDQTKDVEDLYPQYGKYRVIISNIN